MKRIFLSKQEMNKIAEWLRNEYAGDEEVSIVIEDLEDAVERGGHFVGASD